MCFTRTRSPVRFRQVAVLFCWLFTTSIKYYCIARESNPGRKNGNLAWYHYTSGALRGLLSDWVKNRKMGSNWHLELEPKNDPQCHNVYCWWQSYIFLCADAKMWNASRFCVSSMRRGHANPLCIVPTLVYVLPKQVPDCRLLHDGLMLTRLLINSPLTLTWCWRSSNSLKSNMIWSSLLRESKRMMLLMAMTWEIDD